MTLKSTQILHSSKLCLSSKLNYTLKNRFYKSDILTGLLLPSARSQIFGSRSRCEHARARFLARVHAVSILPDSLHQTKHQPQSAGEEHIPPILLLSLLRRDFLQITRLPALLFLPEEVKWAVHLAGRWQLLTRGPQPEEAALTRLPHTGPFFFSALSLGTAGRQLPNKCLSCPVGSSSAIRVIVQL